MAAVAKVCPGGHVHEPVFGEETRKSQVYPEELSRSVLKVLAGLVEKDNEKDELQSSRRAAGAVSAPAPPGVSPFILQRRRMVHFG